MADDFFNNPISDRVFNEFLESNAVRTHVRS